MFFTNNMSSFGARAPYASNFFVSSCSSCTSSSADSVVGSIVRSRPRSRKTAPRSVSGGNAPRSRSAPSWAIVSPLVAPTSSIKKARRLVSSSRPVIPKSISTVRPSGRTIMLPPCRSPWKTPYNIAPSMNDTSPACSTASVSTPAACIDATSSHGMPSSRSITSTRRVTREGCGRGTIVARCSVSASTPRCRACCRPRGGSRALRRSSPRTARSARVGSRGPRPGCAR